MAIDFSDYHFWQLYSEKLKNVYYALLKTVALKDVFFQDETEQFKNYTFLCQQAVFTKPPFSKYCSKYSSFLINIENIAIMILFQ